MNWKNVKDWNHHPATAKGKQKISWKPVIKNPLPRSSRVTSTALSTDNKKQKLASLLFQHTPLPSLLAPITQLQKLAAFDFEWPNGYIDCFCLQENNSGESFKLHLQQDCHGNRASFISQVLAKLMEYDCITSYGALLDKDWKSAIDGDLKMLENECTELGLESYYKGLRSHVKVIDTLRIFANETIASSLASTGSDYRTNRLGDVAMAYIGERKMEGVTGANVGDQSPDIQMQYCLQDAQLCLKLLQKNGYELLCILYMFSVESGLDFFKTVNAYGPLLWWKTKFDGNLDYPTVPAEIKEYFDANIIINPDTGNKKGMYYEGGKVFDPVMGAYPGATTVDFSSMYPSTIDFRNICTSTIMCDCCKDDPRARIPERVMVLINAKLKHPRPWFYWICCKRRGILSDIMHDLVARKEHYKEAGQNTEDQAVKASMKLQEKAVKLYANSCYGTFGQIYFKYYDVRVAELCTGFARYAQENIKKRFEDSGSRVVGGDTDSCYVSKCNNLDSIILQAKHAFGVKLAVDKQWHVLFMLPKKKQYVGILNNGELKYTTLPGLKDNNIEFYNEVTLRLIDKRLLEEFTINQQQMLEHAIDVVKSAYDELEYLANNKEYGKLSYSYVADRPLNTYKTKCWQKELCAENMSDGSSIDGKLEYRFWKVILKQEWIEPRTKRHKGHYDTVTGSSKYPDRYNLNLKRMKSDLWTCVKWLLQVYGLENDRLKQLYVELLTISFQG